MGCSLETALSVEGPFELVSCRTDSALVPSREGLLNIDDKCSLQLELRYTPTPEEVENSGRVTCHYAQGSLSLLYSNG